ncbi:Proteasome component (PCI) domain protein [Euphorbia peplus]|nr:Proteasome component (PCI) domain protein [Euphorbia peplus]
MAALEYLECLRNEHPELAEWYNSLGELYEKKLWHQLTLKLQQFVALPVFQVSFSSHISIFISFYQSESMFN